MYVFDAALADQAVQGRQYDDPEDSRRRVGGKYCRPADRNKVGGTQTVRGTLTAL